MLGIAKTMGFEKGDFDFVDYDKAKDYADRIRKLAKDVVVNIVFREQKPEYCTGRDCILIDDLDKNIKAWEALGGTGIFYEDAERTLLVLKDLDLL